MSLKTTAFISLLTILGIILGSLLGYYQPDLMLSIGFIGTLFINGLKIIIIPLLIALIVTGVSAMGNYRKINHSIGKTVLYFVTTGFIASIVGLVSAYIIQPGLISSKASAYIPPSITQLSDLSLTGILGSVLPDNFILATAEGQILGLVIFSILFAVALTSLGRQGKIVIEFFYSVKEIAVKLVHYFLYLAPIALFALTGAAVAENYSNSINVLNSLAFFTLTILSGLLFFLIVVLPLALKLMAKKSPVEFFGNLIPAITTGLATGSSAATFPITYDCVSEKSKIDPRASAFVLPLGAVINLNGTAIYLCSAAIFIAQLYGVDLSFLQILIIIGGSLLISIGSTLIPHTSLLMLGVVLSFADFPPQAYAGIGLLLMLDWLFERMRTVVNVAGDAVGAAVIGETFDFKTARKTRLVSSKRTTSTSRVRTERKRTTSVKKESYPGRVKVRKTVKRADRSNGKSKPIRKTDKKPTAPKFQEKKPLIKDTRSPFMIPEIPYHTLEKEYHAKDKDDTVEKIKLESVEKNVKKAMKSTVAKTSKIPVPPYMKKPAEKKAAKKKPVEKKPIGNLQPVPEEKVNLDIENLNLSKETIERERARISAQLTAMKEREKNTNYLNEDTSENKPEPDSKKEDMVEVETVSPPESNSEMPQVDFLAGETDSDESEKKEDTIEEEAIIVSDDSSEKQIEYGRKKPRRGYKKSQDGSESTEESKAETAKPEESPISKDSYSVDGMSFGRSKRKK